MRRASWLVVIGLVASLAPGAASAAPAGCTDEGLGKAARTLVHPDAEVVQVDSVAGFPSALVLEPLIYPGVRHRLIQAGGVWCEASALSEAWRLAGRPDDGLALARAFAQLAGTANFDGVTVRSAAQVAPGLYTVRTHALTNGITAAWSIAVDGQGVRQARWTATGFAVRPFVAETEGLTALPGLVRTYRRTATGRVLQQEPVLPQTAAIPEPITEAFTADDFLIRISASESGISPNAGQDTGVFDVDFYRMARDGALTSYNEFHGWGFRKGWSSNLGVIWVDNSTGAQCLACVVRSATFNIHVTQRVLEALEALGFTYPDDRKALATVLGHEMYHNWQNRYGQPDFNSRHSSFSEGTARMQETTHSYSDVSYQTNSLIYSTGREIPGVSLAANSCNGWDGANRDTSFAQGPFTGKSYNACYFWLTWYGTHGPAGQLALLQSMKTAQLVGGDWPEQKAGIEGATGQPILGDLAVFARASLSGHGYTWGPGAGTGPAIDWGTYLDRWQPPSLAAGATMPNTTIQHGGMVARKITEGGYPSLASNRTETALAVVRSTEEGATEEILEPGVCIEPPVAGEDMWLVAIHPITGSASVSMSLTPLAPGETQCPEDDEEDA
ncbi:MAG TPA: hypothetical protein VGB28_09190 [Actinomycetota bacterium]